MTFPDSTTRGSLARTPNLKCLEGILPLLPRPLNFPLSSTKGLRLVQTEVTRKRVPSTRKEYRGQNSSEPALNDVFFLRSPLRKSLSVLPRLLRATCLNGESC